MRVTKKAADAYRVGRLLGRDEVFPIEKLSPFRKPPTVLELEEAFALDHFARCFMDILELNTREEVIPFPHFTEEHKRHLVWMKTLGYPARAPGVSTLKRLAKERLTRALYRVVIWGAVMSRAYQQPLFEAADHGLGHFVEKWTYPIYGEAQLRWDGQARHCLQLSNEEFEHLSKYPVYRGFNTRLAPYNGNETAEFSSLMEWLMADINATEDGERLLQRHENRAISQRTHPLPAKDQIAQVAWVTRVLKSIIVDVRGRLRARHRTPMPFMHSTLGFQHEVGQEPRTRKLTLILPGLYQPEHITMPARVGDMIEIPGLDCDNVRMYGLKRFTRCLFVAEPATMNPCGVEVASADAKGGRYIAFPSLLSRITNSVPTSPVPKLDLSPKLNVEHRLLASLLHEHLGHPTPIRFLENIVTNPTDSGDGHPADCLHAGVRWYRSPRPARREEEDAEETDQLEQTEESSQLAKADETEQLDESDCCEEEDSVEI